MESISIIHLKFLLKIHQSKFDKHLQKKSVFLNRKHKKHFFMQKIL